MYYPYLRGKRHELSALRKISSVLNSTKVCPVIEPVKANTTELTRTITNLNSNGHIPIVIINPLEGDLANTVLNGLLTDVTLNFLPCIAFSHHNLAASILLVGQLTNDNIAYTTYFKDEVVGNISTIISNARINFVFTKQSTSANFISSMPQLVKIQDCFEVSERNADYPLQPYNYSDAHITYNSLANSIGFGDFQIVGERYSGDAGGPARAVAIHITYIDSTANNHMLIKHCVSTLDSGTTSNTGNKFLQALNDVISFANMVPDVDQSTVGFLELISYHTRQHYPNLGPVKECSIMHHIQSIERQI